MGTTLLTRRHRVKGPGETGWLSGRPARGLTGGSVYAMVSSDVTTLIRLPLSGRSR
jgi:hypothetical protein